MKISLIKLTYILQICDSNLYIMNVNAKFGGATHDSHIWSSSKVEPYMRGLHQRNEQVWLLGKWIKIKRCNLCICIYYIYLYFVPFLQIKIFFR